MRADALPDVVAGVARRTPRRSCAGSAAPPSSSTSRRWSTASTAPRPTPRALRRGNFMARMRMSVAVRPLGDVGRARRRDRQQDRVAHRLHDGLRRLRLRVQPDRRPVQEPGPPAGGRHRRARTRSSRKAPSADLWPGQTDEAEGGFSYPQLDRLLFWRIDKRRSIDEVVALGFDRALVERVDRMVAGAEFKRQVPPIAKLGPRTAGVDYLYPRRRPGSARE